MRRTGIMCGTGILPVRLTGWKPVPHEEHKDADAP